MSLFTHQKVVGVDLTTFMQEPNKIYFVNIFFLSFRDISFLYDVKYVTGETRERAFCPPHMDRSSQSHDGVIVPHKVNKVLNKLFPHPLSA